MFWPAPCSQIKKIGGGKFRISHHVWESIDTVVYRLNISSFTHTTSNSIGEPIARRKKNTGIMQIKIILLLSKPYGVKRFTVI